MFNTAKLNAAIYAHLAAETATFAYTHTKEFASDHKSELITSGATAVVVGLAARVAGFKAGYAFATNKTPII
jgi:hypothetical protein